MDEKPSLLLILPTYNEAAGIRDSVLRLWEYCRQHLGDYAWHITVADNGSTDTTGHIVRDLSKAYPHVSLTHFERKGRGRALKDIWSKADYHYSVYMDADLSTALEHVGEIVRALHTQGYDLAVGTRLHPHAKVINRSPKREVISRSYNQIARAVSRTRFTDFQCGFKGISKTAARELLPQIQDEEWFFDTELLIRAKRHGLNVAEVPVQWKDDPSTTVRIFSTVMKDLKGLWRMR